MNKKSERSRFKCQILTLHTKTWIIVFGDYYYNKLKDASICTEEKNQALVLSVLHYIREALSMGFANADIRIILVLGTNLSP